MLVGFQDKEKQSSKSRNGSPSATSPNTSNIDVKGPFLSVPGTKTNILLLKLLFVPTSVCLLHVMLT
jgi:hypothetical protein